MKMLAVLLSCMVICLPLTYAQVTISATTYCSGGVLPCVANAQCNGGPSGECVCSSGFKGDGRVLCAPASSRCVCAAKADPVFTVTDGPTPTTSDTFKENLPCKINMVNNVLSPDGSCTINYVTIVPEVRPSTGTTGPVFRVFADAVEYSVFNNDGVSPSVVTGTLNELGVTPASPLVTVSQVDGFRTATLTPTGCQGFSLRFNDTYGAVGVDISKSMTFSPSPLSRTVCGNCDSVSDNPGTTPATQQCTALKAITVAARQTGITYAAQCSSLANTVSSCTAANLTIACAICQPYLDDFGQCLKARGITPDAIMTKYANCVNTACNSSGANACGGRTADGNSVSPACTVPGTCPPP